MNGDSDLHMMEKFEKATVVLMDIAGTSSSICFVKDTLFPYVLDKAEQLLTEKWDDSDMKEIVENLRELDSKIVKEGEKDAIVKSVVVALKSLTENNSDAESFKKLQGLVYAAGYAKGELKGHVFADVAAQLPLWTSAKKRVCVYSAGSVDSQKLLFAHSTEGDLSPHIAEYFDLAIGAKSDPASYKHIVEKLKCTAEELLFLTDSVAEAAAALEAGAFPVLVYRKGNEDISEDDKKKYSVISSFGELTPEVSAKRKIEEVSQEAPPAKVAKTESKEVAAVEAVKEETPVSVEVSEKMEIDTAEAEVATEVKEDTMEKSCTTTTTTENEKKTTETEEEPTSTTMTAPEEKQEEVVTKKVEKKETEPEKEVSKAEEENQKTEAKEETVEKAAEPEKMTDIDIKETEKPEVTKKVEETITKNGEEEIPAADKEETEKEAIAAEPVEEKETIKENGEDKETAKIETKLITEKTDEPVELQKEETVDTTTTATTTTTTTTTTEDETNTGKVEGETKKETEKEETKVEKPEENGEKKEVEESASKNGDEKTENGDKVENGTGKLADEKENMSELANGAHKENGEETAAAPAAEEETEIKVKKLETAESGVDKKEAAVEVKA